MKQKMQDKTACPCGGKDYAACCGRFHAGEVAPGADLLMRSRYSAYVLNLPQYLFDTWHPDTRPALQDLAADPATRWLGLEVKRHESEGDAATVEFVARYKQGGRAHRLHEVSRFVRQDGRWLYVDGSFPDNGK